MHRPAVPRRQQGMRPPLFDRLLDLDPGQADSADARLLAEADLRHSVARHLGHLLDARRAGAPAGAEALTVLDWGVPDLAGRPLRDPKARAAWLDAVGHAVRRFEPRLRDPRLTLQPAAESGRAQLRIEASLAAAEAASPVLFEMAIDTSAGGDA